MRTYERIKQRVADEIMSVWNEDKSPLEIADQILSLKGVRVEAGDQSLPRFAYLERLIPMCDWERIVGDVLKMGFVKCLPKKGTDGNSTLGEV